MIDIDKMVEVVAENIVKVGKDRLYDPQYDTAWAGKIPDDVLHERKMKLARIYAKAAIKAFCKELPTMRNLIAMAKALIAIDDTSAIPNPMVERELDSIPASIPKGISILLYDLAKEDQSVVRLVLLNSVYQ